MSRPRVLTALSGGVDSSVAALLLQQQGYDVVGVFLRNGVPKPPAACDLKQGCCSEDDALDAAKVADRLGIPFHAIDMAEEFRGVMDYFANEYALGRTPNPCAICNRDIKFGALLRFADALGAEYLATGHYAQTRTGPQGVELWRGADPRKDQSYVLFPVGPAVLARTLLPIGGMHKSETRRIAQEAGLPVFAKPDSVEICFVPTGDYRDMLRARGGLGQPGRLVHVDGRVLGEHDGHMGFTRGQRRGIGVAAASPLYVLDVDAVSGDVRVGPRSATACAEAGITGFQTFAEDAPEGTVWTDVSAQYRSSPGGSAAELHVLAGGRARARFLHPAESVTPGQGLAVYRGDRLLGGGWIETADLLESLAV
jgi:tRNA-specific 2-thiouridylase